MDTRVTALPSTTSLDALFAADDLLGALDAYEDLPLDLILVGSEDLAISPLDTPSPLFSSPSPCTTSDSASPGTVDGSTARVPRSQKIKAEISFLQDQIAQLERELITVKHAKQSATTPALWRDVAKRQRARRSAAECENERLRAKVMRQIQVAKSLQVVLHYRSQHQQLPTQAEPTSTQGNEDDAWMDDLGQVLRRFAVDVEQAYNAVDTVLPLKGTAISFDASPRIDSVVRTHTEIDGREQLYVETTQAYMIPFPFNDVTRVAWLAFTTHFEKQQRQLELYCYTDDLFACKFAGNARDARGGEDNARSAAATTIARSYQASDNCSVVVWRGFIAPTTGTMREAVAVSTGWIVFRPLEGYPQCAVAHVCIRTVPKSASVISLADQSLVRLPTTERAGVGPFISQKLCTTAEDIMAVMEEVENILLDDTVVA